MYLTKISFLLLVLSSSIFASRARMDALSQDSDRGSFYIKDERYLFSNPATISGINNLFFMEWGKSDSSVANTSSNPHAEGGIVKRSGIFNWGVYLGSEINSQNDVRPNDYLKNDGRVDLFLGGNAGFVWGVRLNYSSSEDESGLVNKDHSAYGFGIGTIIDDFQIYANIDLKDNSNGAVAALDTFDAKLGIDVGVTFPLGDYVFGIGYRKSGFDEKSSTSVSELSTNEYYIDIGNVMEIDSKTRIYTNVKILKDSQKLNDTNVAVTNYDNDGLHFPLVIGFEHQAFEKLQVRGSVSQDIGGGTDVSGNRVSKTNSTTVNFGASVVFKNFKLDGLLGTTGKTGNDNKEGILSTDSLMTRVGISYMF